MDVKALQPFVIMIVLVGMILGVGVLVFDKFGLAVYTATGITNESLT